MIRRSLTRRRLAASKMQFGSAAGCAFDYRAGKVSSEIYFLFLPSVLELDDDDDDPRTMWSSL